MNEQPAFTHVPESAASDEEMEIALAGTMDEEKLSNLLEDLEGQLDAQSKRLQSEDKDEVEKAKVAIARIMKWQMKAQDEMTERAKSKGRQNPLQGAA